MRLKNFSGVPYSQVCCVEWMTRVRIVVAFLMLTGAVSSCTIGSTHLTVASSKSLGPYIIHTGDPVEVEMCNDSIYILSPLHNTPLIGIPIAQALNGKRGNVLVDAEITREIVVPFPIPFIARECYRVRARVATINIGKQ
jgi:hypothetical protein